MRTGACFPFMKASQIDVSYPVCFSSQFTRVNATWFPSGDSSGSATQMNSNKSLSASRRLPEEVAVCAESDETAAISRIERPIFMRILVSDRGARRVCTVRRPTVNCFVSAHALTDVRRDDSFRPHGDWGTTGSNPNYWHRG